MDSQTIVRSLQVVGLTSSAMLAGCNFALTGICVPTYLSASIGNTPLLLSQWDHMFKIGVSVGPPAALVTSASLAGAAYMRYSGKSSIPTEEGSVTALATASVLALAIVPFTLVTLQPINSKLLMEAAASVKSVAEVEVRSLVEKWAFWNGVRGMIPLVGAVVGLYGVL